MTYPTHVPQVVRLRMPNAHGLCTGFVIKKGVVATAAHCVTEDKLVEVKFITGTEKIFHLVAAGKPGTGDDWAILAGDTGTVEPYNFPTHPPALPFSTYSIGYGPSGPQSLVPATILGLEKDRGASSESLVIISDVDHGDSGGPLLGFNGTVLGIVYALQEGDGQGFVVPYQVLEKALKDNKL